MAKPVPTMRALLTRAHEVLGPRAALLKTREELLAALGEAPTAQAAPVPQKSSRRVVIVKDFFLLPGEDPKPNR